MKCKSPNVSLQDELLTRTSQLRTGQPSIFAIQVWHIAYCITCTTKLINTTARLVRAHLDFCTSDYGIDDLPRIVTSMHTVLNSIVLVYRTEKLAQISVEIEEEDRTEHVQ